MYFGVVYCYLNTMAFMIWTLDIGTFHIWICIIDLINKCIFLDCEISSLNIMHILYSLHSFILEV